MWGQLKNYWDQVKDQLPQQLSQITDQINQHISPLTSSFNASEEIQINNRTYKVLRVLGEGGYSTVYLVESSNPQQTASKQYALKKILIGSRDQLSEAQHEIDIMQLPQLKKHPNILSLIDAAIVSQSNDTQIGYMLFPVFEINAWDCIQKRQHASQPLQKREIISIFIQICDALHAMHSETPSIAHRDIKPHNILLNRKAALGQFQSIDRNFDDGDVHATRRDSAHSVASSRTTSVSCITDNGGSYHAVLMDFGSAAPAVVQIKSRSDALLLQESAERYCTAPYRAPELWDVPSECCIDAGVDIWSLGCVLYYLIVGETPFERTANVAGGSLMLAVVNGQYSWPESIRHMDEFKHLVSICLEVDSSKRARIEQVVEKARSFLNELHDY